MSLFARKNIDDLQADAFSEGEHSLKRELGVGNLISLGIGAIIGTGIFVLTGTAAAQHAGPAIMLAFVLAGIACVFAGLCYAEFAAMIPIAGSAYTYGYATLGEIVAWIIGWDLILEYLFGAATVAAGWSGYVNSILRDIGIDLGPAWTNAPGHLVQTPGTNSWVRHTDELAQSLAAQGIDINTLPQANGMFNIVAALGIFAVTVLLVLGIKESARFNNVAVAIKLAVVGAFILAGGYYVLTHWSQSIDHWTPFIPANTGPRQFGWDGIVAAGGVIFFAYIGFDAVSTTAQEAKNPQRDMPIGILGSLLICTLLYIIVSGIMTAIVDYPALNVAEPIAVAIEATGYSALAKLIKVGAIAGLTSVMLVMLMSQPRIFFAMSRDGLLPPIFSRLHPRFRTPHISSAMTGLACAALAGLYDVSTLGHLVSIGTLLAFVIVCGGVWYLRVKEPNRPRPFKTPLVPLVPILGMVTCIFLMSRLPREAWERLVIWLAIGMVIYFLYGRRHSVVQRLHRQAHDVEPPRPTYTSGDSR
ncbi:amino acid permease [Longimicrobium terrae]|uniref:APA family basic amino acid/polyamine antiporter n=1 Tax=Longimicrobium terrae TaxID=1639882 RepID=A0A841H6X9_9BACT|nr:amino acid permease [Longimicrobium terrae]MBB4639485.1 APA family basic amino acid/polyamine antiporter [Longimicrobium terrae]MBB6073857.1 APA family basic amino acid/polyamine antiporter [Longimicrobium terrae]NNC32533.1 amino acid permease [Longimicrobium terrae]